MIQIAPATFRGRERTGSGVLECHGDDWHLVGVVDGAGSWGHGAEAADWSREQLQSKWSGEASLNAQEVARDVVACAARLPRDWVEDDFGCAYSVAFLLLRGATIEVVAAGHYSIVGFAVQRPPTNLFRARSWIAEAFPAGELTDELRRTHPLRNMMIGPFIADSANTSPEIVGPARIPAKGRVVLAEEGVVQRLLKTHSTLRGLDAAGIQGIEERDSKGPVIVVSSEPPTIG